MNLGDKMKKMVNSLFTFIKEEAKFLGILLLIYCILQIPVNYYIITGGGTSDVSSRILVEGNYSSKGSFNISYVTELKRANVFSYLISYTMPHWERENPDKYKYSTTESMEDIEFRSNLDLLTANGNATYWSYTLAKKELEEISNEIYIIALQDAEKTPLKIGDKLLSIDEFHYDSIAEYKAYLQTKKANDKVMIKVIRKGKEVELTITLTEYENRIIIGASLQTVKKYRTNPTVDIKFKSYESGPSGGLITALEIYNQLTPKDLTKGLKIAGTGTIEEDGTIGQIGGIEHKLLGAEDDHTDIFLSPEGKNYEDALKYKKAKKLKIKIISVKTLEDAIEKLENLNS